MIKTETIIIDGRTLVRTYSSEGRYVVRDGISYEEAVDPVEMNREYTEGELIEYEVTEEDYAQIGKIMMGVEE